ncbi:cytochrome P450 [Pseudovirgaria hyperparasitica]|uniref:Cytochrome P450 n=1 Tax=Pseudovirgaria hyperparasitica TaxID=470096 RepID=A0A6A6WA49_9PEZI|nr:cytochrome P450 [Pseudovirgaria hyperparasitica]KAF2759738.1 cytochrome P450 [Pseudovirgaria hyperparasitica]
MILSTVLALVLYGGPFAAIPTCLLVFLISFRLWAFTIKPILNPNEPKELPYWIPSHALEFVKNGDGVITRAQKYFKNQREPFALTVGGQKLYFVSSPDDTVALYRNSATLSVDKVVYDVTNIFGVSKASCDKFYEAPESRDADLAAQAIDMNNADLKPLAHLNMIFWKEQLVPGPRYNEMLAKVSASISSQVHKLSGRYTRSTEKDGSKIVSLLELTREVLIDAVLRAFFGDSLMELNPNVIDDSMQFDKESWKLWYKVAGARSMLQAKQRLLETTQTWLSLPEERREGACDLVKRLIVTERAVHFPEKDIAEMMSIVIFATNTNTYKAAFWALAHLVEDPQLLQRLRSGEVAAAAKLDESEYLQFLADSCPLLTSLFAESLRVYTNSHSKMIPVNARVMVPYRQMHMHDVVWGDSQVFDAERFERNPKMLSSTSLRPFGGGHTYCPGRFLAKAEVLILITRLLSLYDIEKIDDKGFPQADLGTPVAGLMGPLDGEDVLLKLTPRLHS